MDAISCDKRNYGIDALRLYAMLLVVMLHILGRGGVLDSAGGGQFAAGWLLEAFACCAVDCYAIISGYVGFSETKKPFRLSNGYSFVWIIMMYLVGAWMKKCGIPDKIRSCRAVLCGVLCVLAGWYLKVYSPLKAGTLLSYLSPTTTLTACAYVIVFAKLRIPRSARRVIAFLSPAAFGVYLIHTQAISWNYLLNRRFSWISDAPIWMMPIWVVGCALGIMAVCLFIEKARILIFRVLRISALVERAAVRVRRLTGFLSLHLLNICSRMEKDGKE